MSEPGIYEYLSGTTPAKNAEWDAKVAVVVTLIGDRTYPDRIPQHHFEGPRVMPCAVFQQVGGDRQKKFCGTDKLVGGQFQLDIYSPQRDDVPAIAGAIRRAMVDYSGPMGPARVSEVLLDNEFNVPPEPDPGLYRRTQLYTIWYLED